MQTVVLGRPHSTVNDGDTIATEPDISEHGERKQGAGWFRNRSGKKKRGFGVAAEILERMQSQILDAICSHQLFKTHQIIHNEA